MKKLMFVLVALLLVSTCFALESGPSNKVGYVKFSAATGSTAFGLPFVFWDVPTGNIPTYGTESRRPSDIIGTQADAGLTGDADRIIDQNSGSSALRRSDLGGAWTGTLETGAAGMVPSHAFYFVNRDANVKTIVLAGEADTTGTGIPMVTVTAPTVPNTAFSLPYSWRDPRERNVNAVGLIGAGFRGASTIGPSDKVVAQIGGGTAWYDTDIPAWAGSLTLLAPGSAYWLVNRHYGLPAWSYTYNGAASPINMPNGDVEQFRDFGKPAVTPSVKANTATK